MKKGKKVNLLGSRKHETRDFYCYYSRVSSRRSLNPNYQRNTAVLGRLIVK